MEGLFEQAFLHLMFAFCIYTSFKVGRDARQGDRTFGAIIRGLLLSIAVGIFAPMFVFFWLGGPPENEVLSVALASFLAAFFGFIIDKKDE